MKARNWQYDRHPKYYPRSQRVVVYANGLRGYVKSMVTQWEWREDGSQYSVFCAMWYRGRVLRFTAKSLTTMGPDYLEKYVYYVLIEPKEMIGG